MSQKKLVHWKHIVFTLKVMPFDPTLFQSLLFLVAMKSFYNNYFNANETILISNENILSSDLCLKFLK